MGPSFNRQTEPTGFIYFDSNVISYIVRGVLPNFVKTIIDAGWAPIASEVVLQEVQRGIPAGELEFIEENGFMFAFAHEALFIDGRKTFYTTPLSPDAGESEHIEAFLRKFVRSISGSASVGDLTTLLLNASQSVLEDVSKELSPDTDPRILAAWDQSKQVLLLKFDELESLPVPTLLNAELQDLQHLASVIGNFKPPRIFDQIIDMKDFAGTDFLAEMRKPFATDENMKERIQLLCLTLISMGFARDKRLPNDDGIKSESGAKSQFSDAYHIAAAATCDVFVTADRRCAKLAFAVYEALNFRTEVCLARPENLETPFAIVGKEFWP
jgi:hypothetical protein